MSENIIVKKIVGKTLFNKEQDRYMIKNQIRSYYANSITGHRLSRNPIKITEEWSEIPNISKRVSLNALIKKVALDPESMEQIQGFFTIKVEANVLSDKIYKFLYLSVDNNRIFQHAVNSGMTCPLALSGNSEGVEKHFSKPIRITDVKAVELLEAGCPLFEMQKEGEFKQIV